MSKTLSARQQPRRWHGGGPLFGEAFPPANRSLTAAGNVLAAAAFLCGLAVQQLSTGELEHVDPNDELVITCGH